MTYKKDRYIPIYRSFCYRVFETQEKRALPTNFAYLRIPFDLHIQ